MALPQEEKYAHRYPYDWRTKQPVIFRATEQWFASVEGFKAAAMEAIGGVQWIPSSGVARITSMTQSRSDWCISRQRKWGVPLPVFYDNETGELWLVSSCICRVSFVVQSPTIAAPAATATCMHTGLCVRERTDALAMQLCMAAASVLSAANVLDHDGAFHTCTRLHSTQPLAL